MNQIDPLKILAFAALALSVRVLTWISLIGAMAVFAFAVWKPDDSRTLAASLFAMLVFIPALWSEKRERKQSLQRMTEVHQQYTNGATEMEERL